MSSAAVAVDSFYNPNHLCEELLLHMLDCPTCLDGSLDSDDVHCQVSAAMRSRIDELGGATQAAVFAY